VTRSIETRSRTAALALALVAALFLLTAGQARAAADVYPAGGGTFSGGAQGWQVTDASCNVPLLCSASGGYDGSAGNPAGSIAANTSILLNLLTVFSSTVTVQSPDFTVRADGASTLHLERQFAPGNLVDLAPQTSYTVTLIDRTAGNTSVPLTESLKAGSGFVGKDAAANVVAGHSYAISIATETSSTVAGTGLLAGSTSTRFDNVSLSVQSGGGNGGGDGGSGNANSSPLSDQQLRAAIQGSLTGPATLKGRKLFVKTRCPARVGRACRVTLQGLLKKRKAATSSRVVKVAKGKSKRIALQLKPKARGKVVARKRLLFKQTVKAGKAKATVYKRLKLIRH
jgi:hypothetical protein